MRRSDWQSAVAEHSFLHNVEQQQTRVVSNYSNALSQVALCLQKTAHETSQRAAADMVNSWDTAISLREALAQKNKLQENNTKPMGNIIPGALRDLTFAQRVAAGTANRVELDAIVAEGVRARIAEAEVEEAIASVAAARDAVLVEAARESKERSRASKFSLAAENEREVRQTKSMVGGDGNDLYLLTYFIPFHPLLSSVISEKQLLLQSVTLTYKLL
jgi:hypothetical protein